MSLGGLVGFKVVESSLVGLGVGDPVGDGVAGTVGGRVFSETLNSKVSVSLHGMEGFGTSIPTSTVTV